MKLRQPNQGRGSQLHSVHFGSCRASPGVDFGFVY